MYVGTAHVGARRGRKSPEWIVIASISVFGGAIRAYVDRSRCPFPCALCLYANFVLRYYYFYSRAIVDAGFASRKTRT